MAINKLRLSLRKTHIMKVRYLLFSLVLFFLSGCQNPPETVWADTIILGGNILTMDGQNPWAQAVAVKNGKIIAVGTDEEIVKFQSDSTQLIQLKGEFVMPGFIEGHGHFSSLGASLINLNFLKSKNWNEIVAQVAEKVKNTPSGDWIIGRGWHQEKWNERLEKEVLGYPYHDHLSEISPDNPVMLIHASGHSLFANEKAMELAGISHETPNPIGGEIVRGQQGEAIGVFEETAMDLIKSAYREYLDSLSKEKTDAIWNKGISLAQEECLKKGSLLSRMPVLLMKRSKNTGRWPKMEHLTFDCGPCCVILMMK